MKNTAMLRRVIGRSLRIRGGRSLIALSALTLAAALITTMLALYGNLEQKLDTEFRAYGANIVVAANNGGALPEGADSRVRQALGAHAEIVPTAMAVASAKRKDGSSAAVVVVGADLVKLRRLNSWWKVSGIGEGVLAGKRAAESLDPTAPLRFGKRSIPWVVGMKIESGSSDDDRLFMELEQFERWTGVKPKVMEISYTGSTADTNAAVQRLQQAFTGNAVEVKPVRQIVESEGRVIRKTRAMMLACGLLIGITVALCVTSTLMASVLERRRDFALMKALGASQRIVAAIFASEAMLLGLVAAVLGFIIGAGLAESIGHVNFHASIVPNGGVLPVVVVSSIAIALIASVLPLVRLRRVQPAVILKGE